MLMDRLLCRSSTLVAAMSTLAWLSVRCEAFKPARPLVEPKLKRFEKLFGRSRSALGPLDCDQRFRLPKPSWTLLEMRSTRLEEFARRLLLGLVSFLKGLPLRLGEVWKAATGVLASLDLSVTTEDEDIEFASEEYRGMSETDRPDIASDVLCILLTKLVVLRRRYISRRLPCPPRNGVQSPAGAS